MGYFRGTRTRVGVGGNFDCRIRRPRRVSEPPPRTKTGTFVSDGSGIIREGLCADPAGGRPEDRIFSRTDLVSAQMFTVPVWYRRRSSPYRAGIGPDVHRTGLVSPIVTAPQRTVRSGTGAGVIIISSVLSYFAPRLDARAAYGPSPHHRARARASSVVDARVAPPQHRQYTCFSISSSVFLRSERNAK